MSASSDIKTKICEDLPASICCRRSLLRGILFAKGERDKASDKRVSIRLLTADFARYVGDLILEIYGKPTNVETPKAGGRGRILSFDSSAACKYLDSLKTPGILPYKPECSACESAFLRGIFLASGRLTDPKKDYALEFSCEGREERYLSCFSDFLGIPAKITHRREEVFLRLRNTENIENFFALSDLNGVTFDLINQKIERSLRSEANRIRNFETGNIDKATSASVQQVAKLRALQEAGLFGMLPDDLAATAKLRIENESLSLSQLALLTTPKISKSGLSHRLERIMKECDFLLKNKP